MEAAPPPRGLERREQARMFLVAREDLVAGPEPERRHHGGDSVGGGPRERDVLGGANHQPRKPLAQLAGHPDEPLEVRPAGAPLVELVLDLAYGGLRAAGRHRAVGPRVQERDTCADRELGAEGVGVHGARC